MPELIAHAKKNPGSLSFAVTGVGRLTHLTGELLQIRSGIKLQMVPYTGGSAQALADIVAGRVALVIEGYRGLGRGVQSGQLKALAIASEKRLAGPRPIFRPWPKRCRASSPSAGSAWWRRSERRPRSCTKISDDLRAVLVNAGDQGQARGARRLSCIRPLRAEAEAFVHSQQELWKPALEQVELQFKKT